MIKVDDGLPWSTCGQGFVSRGEILATSVVNKVVYTKYSKMNYATVI